MDRSKTTKLLAILLSLFVGVTFFLNTRFLIGFSPGHNSDYLFLKEMNMNHEGMEDVKRAMMGGRIEDAKAHFVQYKDNNLFNNPSPLVATSDLTVADDILNHYFVYQDAGYFAGEDIEWDALPSSDKEWTWFLNRHYWASDLARAYLETSDERYAREFVSLFLDFYHDQPYGTSNSLCWRQKDTTRRVRNHLNAYEVFMNSEAFTTDAKFKWYKFMWEQAYFLSHDPEKKGNGAIMCVTALLRCRVAFPEMKDAPYWELRAWSIAKEVTRNQLLPDGVHDELSTHYHNVVVDEHLDYFELLLANDLEIDDYMYSRVEDALNFTMDMHTVTGKTMTFNDADACDDTNLLERGAVIYNRSDFLYIATSGVNGTPPIYNNKAYKDAGFFLMRSGRGFNSTFLMFDGGPPGTSHVHHDLLSFALDAFGTNLLLDPGRGTYDESQPERDYLRSSRAHNLFTLDGIPLEGAIPDLAKWYNAPTAAFASATHSFWGDSVSRHILYPFNGRDYYVILDKVHDGTHLVENQFHFHDPAVLATNNNHSFESTTASTGYIKTYCAQTWNDTMMLVNSTNPMGGIYSPTYNNYQPATTVIQSKQVSGTAWWATILRCDTDPSFSSFDVSGCNYSIDSINYTGDAFSHGSKVLNISMNSGYDIMIWNDWNMPIDWNSWQLEPGLYIFAFNHSSYLEELTMIDSKGLRFNGKSVFEVNMDGNHFNTTIVPIDRMVACSQEFASETFVDGNPWIPAFHKEHVIFIE